MSVIEAVWESSIDVDELSAHHTRGLDKILVNFIQKK